MDNKIKIILTIKWEKSIICSKTAFPLQELGGLGNIL